MIPNEPANPYFNKPFPNCAHLTRIDGFQLTGTIKAHDYGISSIDIHPTKSIIATGSDDHTWRAWTVPDGDHLMTGEGHTDWLSSVKFHPKGELLASTSGDGTVKVWNISQSTSPTITLSDHRQPVWGCSWHWSGLLLASVGMDHCCRLWDIQSEECVLSLRGHADSVNNVHFLSYSNVLATCSADKTVALWDIRTGLCIQTFYHHQNACNDVIANYQATEMYSADCFGVVIKWDLQTYKCISHWDLGPFPTNTLAIDPANTVLACGSGSERISLIELESNKTSNLSTNGNIEGISYGHKAEIMYSVDSNGFIGVWQ
jgi:WD40 repeat protein